MMRDQTAPVTVASRPNSSPSSIAARAARSCRGSRGDDRSEGPQGYGQVKEQDAAGLADELRGQRRVLEGADDHGRQPQPEKPGGGDGSPFLHGFHTTGNSIKPAVVTAPS